MATPTKKGSKNTKLKPRRAGVKTSLPKRLEQNSYADAKRILKEFEHWLSQINESAAESLREAREEILTLHRLKVPALLRKTFHSTNPIESKFSTVRGFEDNFTRYRGNLMSQRWLGAVLLYCEQGFKRVKGGTRPSRLW
jgi:putative transposase